MDLIKMQHSNTLELSQTSRLHWATSASVWTELSTRWCRRTSHPLRTRPDKYYQTPSSAARLSRWSKPLTQLVSKKLWKESH